LRGRPILAAGWRGHKREQQERGEESGHICPFAFDIAAQAILRLS